MTTPTDMTQPASVDVTQEEELRAIAKFVDDFRAPWGSWKTAWWEGEVSDDAAFTPDNALMHIANMARRAAHRPASLAPARCDRPAVSEQAGEVAHLRTIDDAIADMVEAARSPTPSPVSRDKVAEAGRIADELDKLSSSHRLLLDAAAASLRALALAQPAAGVEVQS